MTQALLALVVAMVSAQAFAATPKEICKERTHSKVSYGICMKYAIEGEHLAACADATLTPSNTFKTVPFKNCLKVASDKKLAVLSIKKCEETSGTHTAFALCLDQAQ